MRIPLALLCPCLAAPLMAAETVHACTVDLRLGLGVGPGFEIEHARSVRGTTESIFGAVVEDLVLTRGGGPVVGLTAVSSSAERSSGAHEKVAVSALVVELGWGYRLPRLPSLQVEATAFGGSGAIQLERDGDNLDDLYRLYGARLGAYWTHGDWRFGLEGRFQYGVSDLDDIDGAGTDARLRHRGIAALAVVALTF